MHRRIIDNAQQVAHRLRRGNDGGSGAAAFTPAQIPGLVWWLRADLGVTIGTGVSAWADQSGAGDTGRNATQATGALQPTLNASDANLNGKPSITCAAAGTQNLQTTAWSATYAQPYTLLLIGYANSAVNNCHALGQLSGAFTDLLTLGGPGSVTYGSNALANSINSPTNLQTAGLMMVEATDLTHATIHVNELSSGVSGGGTFGNAESLGLRAEILFNNRTPAANAGWGTIAEVIAVSNTMSAGTKASLRTYINTRYGLSVGA